MSVSRSFCKRVERKSLRQFAVLKGRSHEARSYTAAMSISFLNPSFSNSKSLRFLIIALTAVLSFGVTSPAKAAVKAGSGCTKVNAKIKIGGDSYVCAKNPTVKKAKLTWVWNECLKLDKIYLDNKTKYESLKKSSDVVLANLDLEIAALKANATSDETKAKSFDQKALDAKAKQTTALAEAQAASDNVAKFGATTAAGKSYQSAAAQWTKAARSYELAAKNFERSAANLRSKIDAVSDKEKMKVKVLQNLDFAKSSIVGTEENRKNACQPGL